MSQQYGYSGKILKVDLSSRRSEAVPTSDYADFIGGRGIAVKVHWDEVPASTRAFDPENRLVFITGPLTGFAGFASPRWQVCARSPATERESFCYSNLGGSWGVALKFAGYDGIVVSGRSEKPVYLQLGESGVEFRDAAHLWGGGAIQTRRILKSELGDSVSVVACGQAGENRVLGAITVADGDATGTGSMGAVMGSKNLKAIAVQKGSRRPLAAQPEKLQELVKYYRLIRSDSPLTSFFDQYQSVDAGKVKNDFCWGCPGPCIRIAWKADNGDQGKFFCQSAMLYQTRAKKFYGSEGDIAFRVTKLCDDYGIDTRTIHIMMSWLSRCQRAGILTEQETGIPLDKVGSIEFAETLLRKVALREGFGDVLAHGVAGAARIVGKDAEEQIGDLLHKAEQDELYGARIYIVNSLIWALDSRQPIQHLHETSMITDQWVNWVNQAKNAPVSTEVFRKAAQRFYGSEAAADLSTYEGKALAAKTIQDREHAKESLILCDMAWPIMTSTHTADGVGDSSLESRFYSAVTGKDVNEQELCRFGEKIFNLQRALHIREGHRGRLDDKLPDFVFDAPLKYQTMNPEMLVPGPEGKPVSRKGAVLDRAQFENMKSEYYGLRGWDEATGKQTRSKLEQLGLGEVARVLENLNLLA